MIKKLVSLILIISLICSVNITAVVSSANDVNLISYDFEDSETWEYWSDTGSKNTYTVTEASVTGESSMFLYDTSKTSSAGFKSGYFNVNEGYTYTFLVSAFVIKTKVYMYLRFYDKDNKQLTDDNSVFTGKAWEEKAITKKAPAGAVKGQIIVCTVAIDIAGAYIDNVKVKEGTHSPRGVFSARIPAKLPEIIEASEDCEVFDDGYDEGELIYFQSFEEGIGDWKTYVNSDSYKIVSENASNGNNSLYIIDKSETESAGAKSKLIPIAQGNKYTVYMDAYVSVSGISLYARYYNSEGKQLSQQYVNISSVGWNNVRFSLYAPENAISVGFILAGSVAGLGVAYFDNIKFYKGNIIVRPDETEYSEPIQQNAVNSKIVEPFNNKLIYNSYNEYEDKLSDFSYAGYYGGVVNLPETENLPIAKNLSPTGSEDDTKMIQNAIDEVYKQYSGKGMRVIKLKAGKYNVNKNGINLKSGILLSGEGQGPDGTIIYAKDTVNYNVIKISGKAPSRLSENIMITNDYVSSGSNKLTVEDASSLKAGDLVRIVHPSSSEWIEALKMKDILTVYGNILSWQEDEVNTVTERVITSVKGNEITFECGLFIPYEKKYAVSYLYKIDDSERVHDVGIENLRVASYFNGEPYDLNHAKMAIYSTNSKNIFVRNVTSKNMYNGVFGCRDYAKQITVVNCSALDPVSTIVGGNRYPFYADINTEQILFSGCYSFDGRHDYMAVKGTAGPVVFSDSIADKSNACSETHAGFATGVLFENLYQITDRSNGYIGFPNRGYYGDKSPQGWTAAGCVAWNCLANAIIVHKPPLSYQNFTVGVWGVYDTSTSREQKQAHLDGYRYAGYRYNGMDFGPESAFATFEGTPVTGDAYKEAEFTPVNPRSLYKAQLAERFTGNILNAKPNAPVIIYPRPDKEIDKEDNNITISGIYEMGAEAVNIYVDNIPYAAELNAKENSFSLNLVLSEGVHKIYATQIIGKKEGNKTADRFIIVGTQGRGNPSYLDSNYPSEIFSAIVNDPRPAYDKYISADVEKIVNASVVSAYVTKYDSSFKIKTIDIKNVISDGEVEANSSQIDYMNISKVKNNNLDEIENKNQNWLLELDKVYNITGITMAYSHTDKWVNFNIQTSIDNVNWSSPITIKPLVAAKKDQPVTIPVDYLKGKYIKITLVTRNGTNAISNESTTWGPNLPSGCSISLYELMSVMGVADFSNENFISVYDKAYTLKEPFLGNTGIYKGASAIVFANAVESYGGYSRKEYGILISDNLSGREDIINNPGVIRIRGEKISFTSGYGIRFFGNSIQSGKTYFVLPYAIYEDIDGNEITVYGSDVINVIPE